MTVRSVLLAAMGMTVATVGAGVLAIPVTFQLDGVLLVAVALAVVGGLTVVTIDSLVLCIVTLGLQSYEEISEALLGVPYKRLIRTIVLLYNAGTAVGYIVVVGDIFTPLLPLVRPYVPLLATPAHIMIFFWLVVMLPLSMVPRLSSLHHLTLLAVFSIFFISGSIVYRYFFPLAPLGPVPSAAAQLATTTTTTAAPAPESRTALAVFYSFPVLMFSFDCQSLVFQLFHSLPEGGRGLMLAVSVVSVLLTGSVYATVGYFGYLTFRPHVAENILANYSPQRDRLFAVGESLYSVTVMVAFAIVLMPCRDAIFQATKGFNHLTRPGSPQSPLSRCGSAENSALLGPTQQQTPQRSYGGTAAPAAGPAPGAFPSAQSSFCSVTPHVSAMTDAAVDVTDIFDDATGAVVGHIPAWENAAVSGGLALLCLLLALLAPGFLYIVALMGSFCSSIVCFVYPALFRHRLHAIGAAPYTPAARLGVVAMLLCGGLGLLAGVGLLFF